MGIGLFSNIFSRPLIMIGKVSPRCVTSQAARTRLNVYAVALRPGGSTCPWNYGSCWPEKKPRSLALCGCQVDKKQDNKKKYMGKEKMFII